MTLFSVLQLSDPCPASHRWRGYLPVLDSRGLCKKPETCSDDRTVIPIQIREQQDDVVMVVDGNVEFEFGARAQFREHSPRIENLARILCLSAPKVSLLARLGLQKEQIDISIFFYG